MKVPRLFFLFGVCCLAVLIGCGSKESIQNGKVHLKLVHFYLDQKDTWQHDVVEPFMKAHPNIEVEVEAVPFGLYTTKILSSAASGTPMGDVIVIDDWFGQELFRRNYTIPLDSFYHRDLNPDDFFTQFFTVWRKGNNANAPLMAMPAAGGVTALFYNKDLFDKANVKYPDSTWTYSDLLTAAKKLTNNASNPRDKTWGLLLDDGLFTGVDTYIYSNGGKILSDDKTHSAMMEPQTIAAVQSYVDLIQKEHVAPPPDPSQLLGQRFMLGHAAMMLHIDVAKTELKHATFRWDVAAPPKGVAGLMDRQNGQAFGITQTCEQPDSAWQLVKWVVTLPSKTGVNDLFNSAMPLYKPLAHSTEFLDGEPNCNRQALVAINNTGHVFTLITPGWQEWRDHGFTPNMQDMLAGRKSVQEGCAAIDRKINEVLARYRAPQ
ncbi:MAG TPA: sugar ABC transporter substrate-binding protein [Candidatus Kapabacteria bacterium]|jgi:multiple sugar transport system substrate-binding protein|nr:sugar ABC transporter substrate-binding protein [Candidatus Kapabacteria bacterium]